MNLWLWSGKHEIFLPSSIPVSELPAVSGWSRRCEQQQSNQPNPQSLQFPQHFPQYHRLFLCFTIKKLRISSNNNEGFFFFFSLINSTGFLLSADLGIRYYTWTHFRFRMLGCCFCNHGLNTPISKEKSICILRRSMKFMQEDFLLIIPNPILQNFNLTAPSNST